MFNQNVIVALRSDLDQQGILVSEHVAFTATPEGALPTPIVGVSLFPHLKKHEELTEKLGHEPDLEELAEAGLLHPLISYFSPEALVLVEYGEDLEEEEEEEEEEEQ